MEKTVVELFAGVGGFRVGLNQVTIDSNNQTIERDNFQFIWANQWEPSSSIQHAFECYQTRFGKSSNHVNIDITCVDKESIPPHTLLVGGFPCQDYSVARSLSNEKGIEGKKGVLWWQINEILKIKRPPFILLENVDRLLKSPSKQRGRDFGIMLRCLSDLGYGVEWRVINAAEYGHPQKRRRIYIFGFHNTTNYYKNIKDTNPYNSLISNTMFAKAFPLETIEQENSVCISKGFYKDLIEMTHNFKYNFTNAGIVLNKVIYSAKGYSLKLLPITLDEIIEKEIIDEKYFLTDKDILKFKLLKNSKKIPREKNGVRYTYSEGSMSFPDSLNLPGRTMLTSESSINRSTHVIEDFQSKKLRLITPIEAERLNEFPDNWTNTGMPEKRRYFMMGNALVCGVIEKIGKCIQDIIHDED